jgi:diguanylate cyclase (GGDEF)-like protein
MTDSQAIMDAHGGLQSDRQAIARLLTLVERQAALIREQAAELAHSRKIFERSSAAARIGVWQCNLADEALHWTDVVYDIFDMPRGITPDRHETLKCYTPESVKALHEARSRAIAEQTGFCMDAEIVTPKGNRRWIRLTATVESENGVAVRIFGMKQDITEEKILADRTRYLAENDVLTGLVNRSRFQGRLDRLIEQSSSGEALGAMMLIDLDGFKRVNDTFGHAAGDECLKEAARRLQGVCAQADLLARLGGDEFAVLTTTRLDRAEVSEIARRIVTSMAEPVAIDGQMLHFGASVGIAHHQAGMTPSELFMQADTALYAAKAAGRGTFRLFNPADAIRLRRSPVAA